MKMKWLRSLMCLALIAIMGTAPLCALASSDSLYILKVNVDDARLRESASGLSDVIATLKKGTKVLYAGEKSGSLCRVYTAGGKRGYIYKGYLSSYGVMKKSKVGVTTRTTVLYRLSGNSLKKRATLGSGQLVLVTKTSGNWAYVKTLKGKSGYVRLANLEKAF